MVERFACRRITLLTISIGVPDREAQVGVCFLIRIPLKIATATMSISNARGVVEEDSAEGKGGSAKSFDACIKDAKGVCGS